MLPYEKPEDFAEFWAETTAEAMAQPLDLGRTYHQDYPSATHVVEEIRFRGMGGIERKGWIAAPEGARRLPAFLWVPPYGRWSMKPNEYGTREGMVSLSFNLHGEEAFHEETYRTERGYFAEGVERPNTWIFRRIYQDCVIAARLLQAQAEVGEGTVAAMGMSQGAGISVWLGAWCPAVRAVCADMPFLSGIGETLLNSIVRYPLKEVRDAMDAMPLGEARVMDTLSYFDTSFHAEHCAVPTQVSLGQKDPACRPPTVERVFSALPGPKRLIQYEGGHDWHAGMVPNNSEWLVRAFGAADDRKP